MKIVSWNVNSLNVRLPHLLEWLQLHGPDVVCLQETKLENALFPDDALLDLGYRSVFDGQKTYNGVAILSRHRMTDVQLGIPGFPDDQKRVIAATINGVRVVNLYVVNGQDLGTEKYAYKLRWLKAVNEWLKIELISNPLMVVSGDFNIAPDDRDVHDPSVWNDVHILTSREEREALRRILALGLVDAYRVLHQDAGNFSWWDYRAAAFRRNLGLRIDLNLVSEALIAAVQEAGIDPNPRQWERPSDHAPVFVTLRELPSSRRD